MTILYVAFDNPAVEAILAGMDEDRLSGLPAFYYPFKMLLDRGHTIDLLLYSSKSFSIVECAGFGRDNVIQIRPHKTMGGNKLQLPFLLAKATKTQLKKKKYSFVYGMTEGSFAALVEARKAGVPCGMRQFGTQEMVNNLSRKRIKIFRLINAFVSYTYITVSLFAPKSFLLATNDGSCTDELFGLLGVHRIPYHFFFWRSGVHVPTNQLLKSEAEALEYPESYDAMSISHIGRIADVKRQDRSVKILKEMHRMGCKAHLFFVGGNSSETMLETIVELINESGLNDYVHFVGEQSQSMCRKYARNSLATLLPGEWNRVNIFYEAFSEGAVLLTNNNHSLDEFIKKDCNCLLYEENNYSDAAEQLISLKHNTELDRSLRENAYQTAKNRFMSVQERFGKEVELIEACAAGKIIDCFPTVL